MKVNFIMLFHNITGGCWWYGRDWTNSPITHSFFFCFITDSNLSCCQKKKKKQHTPIKSHWRSLNECSGNQTVDRWTVRRWVMYFSSVYCDVSEKLCSKQLSTHEIKSTSTSSFSRIRPVKNGPPQEHFPDNSAINVVVLEWVTSADIDFFISPAHRFLLIASKIAILMTVSSWKIEFSVAEKLPYPTVLLFFLYL